MGLLDMSPDSSQILGSSFRPLSLYPTEATDGSRRPLVFYKKNISKKTRSLGVPVV